MSEQLENIFASFERLSAREQSLILLLIALAVVMCLGSSWFFVSRHLHRTNQRIESKISQLSEIMSLREDYQARLKQQQKLTQEIRNNRNPLLSYVENIARRSGVNLNNASERAGPSTGTPLVKETRARVSLNAVSITALNKFLTAIEKGNRLVKIRGIQIIPNFENPKKLDATVTVGTFKAE